MTAPAATFGERVNDLRAARERIAQRCPEIRVGDVWGNVHGAKNVKVAAIEPLEDDHIGAFPWPMVSFTGKGKGSRWGAPALIGEKLVKRGRGRGWKPPEPEKVLTAADRRALIAQAKAATSRLKQAVSAGRPRRPLPPAKKGKR